MSTATADYSRAAYEQDERRRFLAQIAAVENTPLSERKEAHREWREALTESPEVVAERIGWLLNGSYGQGSYAATLKVIGNPRMNVQAWLFRTIACLEWHCPENFARAAWKSLTDEQKSALAALIQTEIDYAVEQMEAQDA